LYVCANRTTRRPPCRRAAPPERAPRAPRRRRRELRAPARALLAALRRGAD
jgi:hypothetical protein